MLSAQELIWTTIAWNCATCNRLQAAQVYLHGSTKRFARRYLRPIRLRRRGPSHFAANTPQNWDRPRRLSDRFLLQFTRRNKRSWFALQGTRFGRAEDALANPTDSPSPLALSTAKPSPYTLVIVFRTGLKIATTWTDRRFSRIPRAGGSSSDDLAPPGIRSPGALGAVWPLMAGVSVHRAKAPVPRRCWLEGDTS